MRIWEFVILQWLHPVDRQWTLRLPSWILALVFSSRSLRYRPQICFHFYRPFRWMSGSIWVPHIYLYRCYSSPWLAWHPMTGRIHIPAKSPRKWRIYGFYTIPCGFQSVPSWVKVVIYCPSEYGLYLYLYFVFFFFFFRLAEPPLRVWSRACGGSLPSWCWTHTRPTWLPSWPIRVRLVPSITPKIWRPRTRSNMALSLAAPPWVSLGIPISVRIRKCGQPWTVPGHLYSPRPTTRVWSVCRFVCPSKSQDLWELELWNFKSNYIIYRKVKISTPFWWNPQRWSTMWNVNAI